MSRTFPLVAAVALLAGCSRQEHPGFGYDPPPYVGTPAASPQTTPSEPPIRVVRVTAPGGFRYEPQGLRIRSGEVTRFEFSNRDGREHTLVITDLAVVMLAGAGETVEVSVPVDPEKRGEFAYFCSIGDHRASGMEGTITVLPG